MEKCSLCGGKIVNHRCVDCGMPYPEKPHYTLRGETAHTHNVNGEEVLHRVRSAAGRTPSIPAMPRTSRTTSTWKAHAPHPHAPARQLNQTRRPAGTSGAAAGWSRSSSLVWRCCLCCSTCPSEYFTVWRTWADAAAIGSQAPEASIHAEAPAEDMTGVNPYEGVDWGLPTAGGGFGCILEPGYYTIGQQIPEGVYTITPDDGSSLMMTHDDEARPLVPDHLAQLPRRRGPNWC